MSKPGCAGHLLAQGGFSVHAFVGRRLGVGLFWQSAAIAASMAVILVAGSAMDGSLLLDDRDVGLLEHPAIWTFLALQVALPWSTQHSLMRLLRARGQLRAVSTSASHTGREIVVDVCRFMRLTSPLSRTFGAVFYLAGLAIFLWNTYQNQLPRVLLPYDFWDSVTFGWGFWLTRLYKLYIFCWLLPYIALVHAAVLIVVLRSVRRFRLRGNLTLLPFHSDGAGGLAFVATLVTRPILTTVLLGSIASAAAFRVHQALDVTPLLGLVVLGFGGMFAFVVPLAFLRSDIHALKEQALERLQNLQEEHYSRLMQTRAVDADHIREGNDALEYFERLQKQVQAVSEYPHLGRFAGKIGLALTPSAILVAADIYQLAIPILRRVSA